MSNPARTAYRIGIAIWLLTSFFQVWVNLAVGIVGSEDNPQNQSFFGVVVAAAACAYVARLRPDGMVRAMLATTGVQALLGVMIATAPITARLDKYGGTGVMIMTAMFCTMWLASAAAFMRSARHPDSRHAAV